MDTKLEQPPPPAPGSATRHKRKVALVIGYCGTEYNGLQMQYEADQKGVENVLVDVLVEHGHIDPRNVKPLNKVYLPSLSPSLPLSLSPFLPFS